MACLRSMVAIIKPPEGLPPWSGDAFLVGHLISLFTSTTQIPAVCVAVRKNLIFTGETKDLQPITGILDRLRIAPGSVHTEQLNYMLGQVVGKRHGFRVSASAAVYVQGVKMSVIVNAFNETHQKAHTNSRRKPYLANRRTLTFWGLDRSFGKRGNSS